MNYEFIPRGICPNKIDIELDGETVKSIRFHGGCNGNLKAIATLVEGQTIDQVTEKLSGITCGFKSTSCADQLTKGLKEAYEEQTRA